VGRADSHDGEAPGRAHRARGFVRACGATAACALALCAIISWGLSACSTDDRPALREAIAKDEATDRELIRADDAVRKLNVDRQRRSPSAIDEADNILKISALPAADDALAACNALAPKSDWGKKQKDELVKLVTDRKATISRYEEALSKHDDDAMLASLKEQIDIEKRAANLKREIDKGP
jgi:hypothetical protein